jgi:tellurite methyltransferase
VVVQVAQSAAAWLIDNADLWPGGGTALDVACGRGRHSILMARSGFDVDALDRSAEAIAELRDLAERLRLRIHAQQLDLETTPPPDLGSQKYDVVMGFNYLHRPLMPALRDAVKPGGRIFYETFTRRQAERGHPRNPAFLLEAGELERLMAPLTILRAREGDIDGRFIASIVAERPK